MYHSKNPRKKRLTVKVQRCYRIVIQDEHENEVWDDFWFGSKEEAEKIGKDILKKIETEGTEIPQDLLCKAQENSNPIPVHLLTGYNTRGDIDDSIVPGRVDSSTYFV